MVFPVISTRRSGLPRFWSLGIVLLAFSLGTRPIRAQPSPPQQGGLRLLVIDDETGEPIEGAFIRIKGHSPDRVTDFKGRVTLENFPAGRVEADIGAIGYENRREPLLIQGGILADRRVGLSFTGDKLPDVVVSARQEKLYPRYADFHRRQKNGAGYYITWKEIHDKGYSRLGDVLRTVRGVRVQCLQTDCQYLMSRSANCPPAIWVDGRPSDYFGANLPIGDVYGMEVYRGASEMPAEYIGTSMCGAIVLWTKNRQYR